MSDQTAPGRTAGGGSEVGARALQPELRLQHARDQAWRALSRRERTAAELRQMLAGRRVAPALIEQVVGEMIAQGYVDDAAYARRFAEDRRHLDAWGAERIERRLLAAGVAPKHVAAAVAGLDDELEAALVLLRRRVPRAPQTPRERDRALGLLLRKGYDAELAYDAVRRHAGADEAF